MAVARELKQLDPATEIIYIGQTGDSLGDVPAADKNIDRVYTVRAGKFRRYHGEGWRQILDVQTLLKNLRDAFYVLAGLWQSFWLLGKIKPDVIFVKGGFVGVPVGLAATVRRIPYVTHDSDALPGLANRIIAPWAKLHTVAMPKEVYNYPAKNTITVGVPIMHHFGALTTAGIEGFRHQLKLDEAGRVLLVTGGGLGARRMNDAVETCVPELLERYKDLWIVHIAGRQLEAEVRQHYKQDLPAKDQHRVIVKGFVNNMYQYSGAADVIVTRASGTAMAEFSAQAKATVVVPNPILAGGHQLKNAKVLADRKAIRMVSEATLKGDHLALMPPLTDLFDNPAKIIALGKKLETLAQPHAAHMLAVLLLEVAKGTHNESL
ncbi:MAG TPA: glycosyltransferase [Candidatus Saccharimonadales bacterium]|nr:glycosyltransferase [Candidatus Saccharimonadales bacterium]